jgi:hypothetical protein
LKVCNIGVTEVSVEYRPTCAACGLRLTEQPPEEEVKAFLHDLDEALKQKTRQLATEAVNRVLARGGRDDLAKLLDAAQASNLATLVDVMSPDLADFINRLLAEESIMAAPADVLSQLAQQYPSLEEKDIDLVLAQLEQLLRQAFAEARQAHPDKKTIRLMLRY